MIGNRPTPVAYFWCAYLSQWYLFASKDPHQRLINNRLQRLIFAAWENTAIAHATLFKQLAPEIIMLQYGMPAIHLDHVKKLTTWTGQYESGRRIHCELSDGQIGY